MRSSHGCWRRMAAATAALGSLAMASAHNFPYIPTQILVPSTCTNESLCDSDGQNVAYVFSGSGQMLAFNYTATESSKSQTSSTPTLQTITSELPFLSGSDNDSGAVAYSAARTANGSVMVYAGQCAGEGSLWTFSEQDGGQWEQQSLGKGSGASTTRGPYFLGGSLAFSSKLAPIMDEPTFYNYGGMCPTTDSADASTWQTSANYTTSMISLAPSETDGDSYTMSLSSTVGPGTAIAGFTLTELTPSVSNVSETVTQQVSYVVLGGNTQEAFINMSTAAVWSLPEETWTYVSILGPDDGASELAVKGTRKRSASEVGSRSGHTAVLSEDGNSVVVLGGWVGDVTNAADPQLAILEMSGAYSQWQWKIPDSQPSGDGVYGHGAALLPGNVMMVYGGWDIGSGELKTRTDHHKRASSSAPQFLNLTSMQWGTTYTNPNAASSTKTSGHDAPGETGSTPSSKTLGLGLGLGLGLAVLIAVLVAVFFWRRRVVKRRAEHEDAVRALREDASHFINDNDHDEMMERDDFLPWGMSGGGWYTGGQDPYQNGERSLGYESLRRNSSDLAGAMFMPPPGIQRKPVPRGSKAGYMPAVMGTSGRIHPIMEDDEDDFNMRDGQHHTNDPFTPTSEVNTDPFLTPTGVHGAGISLPPPSRASSTPSPEGLRRHDPDVADWVTDADAAEGMLTQMNTRRGRISPTRRGSQRSGAAYDDDARTGSGLSESNRSLTEGLARSGTGRKAGIGGLFGSSGILGAGTEHQKPGSSSSSSYNTAKTSFGVLQAEGPSLLRGNNAYDEDDTYLSLPGSPSKNKPRRGWLGSLRRVFSNSGTTSPSPTTTSTSSRDERRYSADYEVPFPFVGSGLSGELLRRKQGRQDWMAAGEDGDRMRAGGVTQGHDSDWDIERAVEQRLVQVMFTVPKERLRVVNADEGDAKSIEEPVLPLVEPQTAELVDGSSGSSVNSVAQERQREREEESEKIAPLKLRPEPLQLHRRRQHHPHHDIMENEKQDDDPFVDHIDDNQDQQHSPRDPEKAALMIPSSPLSPTTPTHLLHVERDESRRPSHSTIASAQVHTAEAVTMERPRTRVLEMVDSIESMHGSAEGSPRGSPKR